MFAFLDGPVFRVRRFSCGSRRLAIASVAALGCAISMPADASAGETSNGTTPTAETWFGGELRAGSWTVYTGTTSAWGGSLLADGWRVRSVAGYGQFRYERGEPGTPTFREYEARSYFADVMPGYQLTLGQTTVKLFAGGTLIDRNIVPDDPNDVGKLSRMGVKAALETWTNLPHGFAVKLNVSGAHLFDNDIRFNQFSAVAELSTQVSAGVRVGVEAGVATDRNYRAFQFGPTAELALGDGMFLGGSAGYVQSRDTQGAYGRLQFRLQY
jgi:hypothetical protein